MFWISYSAYARGESKEQIDHLLEMVSDFSAKSWHEDERYKLAWKKKYDEMVTHYTQKVVKYGKAYLESPAGIRFKSTVEKCRKSRGLRPVLNITILQEFEGERGIEWGISQVHDIFDILEVITDPTEFESTVYHESLTALI